MKYVVKKFVLEAYESDNLIVIKYFPKKKFLRKQRHSYTVQYLGSGTVWKQFPSFKRCDTSMEEMLSEINERETYQFKLENGLL